MNSQDEKSQKDPLPTDHLEVTLYTRPGCHLCDEAKSQMAPLLAEFGARLREVNIDADPNLRELYNLDVPVIFVADRKVAKHRVDPAQFRRQLVEARRRYGRRD
jgi:glutaredoxin